MKDNLMPRRGAIAYCSAGKLGLITCDEPLEVTYHDGNKGVAWIGIQLTKGIIGDPWSSRTPKVVGYIEDLIIPLPGVSME